MPPRNFTGINILGGGSTGETSDGVLSPGKPGIVPCDASPRKSGLLGSEIGLNRSFSDCPSKYQKFIRAKRKGSTALMT